MIVLMLATVIIIGNSLVQEGEGGKARLMETPSAANAKAYDPGLGSAAWLRDYASIEPEAGRDRAAYAANRAFPGAPPVIPHPLVAGDGLGGRSCLQCHGRGGYVTQFAAWAPVTPHPDWLSCRQCHVPAQTESVFRANTFQAMTAPLSAPALPGSPPPIPHDLQYRQNCLSCHAGPAAPEGLRVSHPERVNCVQCHVPATAASPASTWTRPETASSALP